jgi:hypothetical protein
MKINNTKLTIDLAEYGETYIPRNELSFLGDNNFEKTLEKIKPLVSINPTLSGEGLYVKADSRVGVISGNGLRIQVRPNVSAKEFCSLIRYSIDGKVPPKHFRSFANINWGNGFEDILCLLFCDEIKEIFRVGLSRRYIETEESLKILRGRPLWEMNFPWSANYSNDIFCRHHRLTYDNLDNKLIVSGLRRALILIADKDVRKIALKHFKIFSNLTSEVRPEISMFDIVKKEYNRLNQHYFIAHSLSKMFLFGMRPESLFDNGGSVVSGLVLDMAVLFEMFVEKLLRDFFIGRGFKIRIQGPDRNALLDEEGMTYASIRPDFEIFRNHKIIGVIDAKYKAYWKGVESSNKPTRKISNADLYQLFFYQQRIQRKYSLSKSPIAVIASPLPAEDERGDSSIISERFKRIFWQAGSDKAGDVRLILIPTTHFLRLLRSGFKPQEAIEKINLEYILKSFLN